MDTTQLVCTRDTSAGSGSLEIGWGRCPRASSAKRSPKARRGAAIEQTCSVPSFESEHMAGSEPARETPVRPGMIEVIVGITAAGLVSDPLAVGVNVRRVWMPRLVAKAADSSVMGRATSHGRRAASRNVSTAGITVSVLCIGGD